MGNIYIFIYLYIIIIIIIIIIFIIIINPYILFFFNLSGFVGYILTENPDTYHHDYEYNLLSFIETSYVFIAIEIILAIITAIIIDTFSLLRHE
jgi:hypothetical protein